ncbi:MAG: hypothetical protein GXN93_02210 [Candidatus Diapherotrites archaeon]|nr:hypothetical protein [Candidatus Diapherotrites archaeon]
MEKGHWTVIKRNIWEAARETHTNVSEIKLRKSRKYGQYIRVRTRADDLWDLQRAMQLAERMRILMKEQKRHGALEIMLPGDQTIHIPLNFAKKIAYPEINGISLHHGPPKEPPGKYAITPFGNHHIFDDVGLLSPTDAETDFDVFTARIRKDTVGITIGEVLTSFYNRINHKAERWAEFFDELRSGGIIEEGGPTIYVVYPPGERDHIRGVVSDAMRENGWIKYGYVDVSQRVNNIWKDVLRATAIIPEPERKEFLYHARGALYDASKGRVSRLLAYGELSDALKKGKKHIERLDEHSKREVIKILLQFDRYYKKFGPAGATEAAMKEIMKLLPPSAQKRLKKRLGI